MNGTLPYLFFFSYSRADWDNDLYLAKFYTDLAQRVGIVAGAANRTVGFRDEDGIRIGDDWTRKISSALQSSNVLVCIYSPNFFSKERTHEFCAKEFMAFLKRDPMHRYERVLDEVGLEQYEVRDPRNILPILWLSDDELVRLNKLPPYAVRSLQYTLNSAPKALADRYKAKGMSLITRSRNATYWDIVRHLASRIVELSATQLPSIEPPPDARTLPNAFYYRPESAATMEPAPAQGRSVAEALDDAMRTSLGPKHLMAFEIRLPSRDKSMWEPFAGEPCMSVLVEEIAQWSRRMTTYRSFDPSAADFAASILAALGHATEHRVLPILLIDPEALARPNSRAAIVSLLRHPWRGGVIVPLDASGHPSARLDDFELTPNEREWIVVRPTQGGVAEFRTAVVSVADEILARIVKHGSVERPTPDTDGPAVRPRITNT